MKQQIYWQEQDLNIRSQELNQLVASQLEFPRERSGAGRTEITKNNGNPQLDSTGKGTYIRTLCQKNIGSVEIKQRPIKMDSRTIYRTLSSKGHLFKLGLTDDPTCERCLEEDESATHVLCDCEAITYLRFRHLGQFFMKPSDFYDAPISKVLHFIRSVGLIRG
jgi:hypothetical protein